MSARKLIRNVVTTFVTIIMLSSHYAYAVPSQVLFSALDNGKVILREVKWEIVGLDSNSLQKDKRHTFTAELPQGNYIAKLTCNGRNFERPFKIVTPSHNVVIECVTH